MLVIAITKMGRACDRHRGSDKFIHCACKPEGKRPLGKFKSRFEDNIKMALENKKCVCGCGLDSCGSE
jgi:hypothetical protein